jgi:hypothetical protein
MPGALLADAVNPASEQNLNLNPPQKKDKKQEQGKKWGYNETYTGEYLKRVSFPIGG